MLFNTYTDGDPRSFMYYNGEYYIDDTKIAFKDKYIETNKSHGKKIWKYARFAYQITGNNQISYLFCIDKCAMHDLFEMGYSVEEVKTFKRDHALQVILTASELEDAIEEITYPIKLSREETTAVNNAIMDMIEHPKRDWDDPSLLALWVGYIAVMVGSLIFNQFYIIWAIASVVFYYIRKGML